MANNTYQKCDRNVSKFLIPFYIGSSSRKKQEPVFPLTNWEVIERKTIYLTRYLQEIYERGEKGICGSYRLSVQARMDAGLPAENTTVYLLSEMISGREGEFSFLLKDITASLFSTGIGFLTLDIVHRDSESLEEIADKSFALSNLFTHEHDRSGKPSKLHFYYYENENRHDFSLKNAVYAILGVERLKERIELFPTNQRKKMNVYHSIFREQRNESDTKLVRILSKGLHAGAIEQKEKYDFLESNFEYATTENTSWSLCSNGVVSLSYDEEKNHEFLIHVYSRNVGNDYFLIYLFALHEREILLRYNYDVVKNWNNPKKLVAMKKELIRFNMWFSYNMVSVEMSYQNFYECLYRALKLEKLENDVQEVVAKVDEYVSVNKERRLNGILTAIALLAIFSAFADGLGMVDRLYETSSLEAGHIMVIIFNFLVIGGGIYYFIHRDKH